MLSLISLFIFGTAIGSFLNVLIDRLSLVEPIDGRSYCDHCKKPLKGMNLFPIFSFILQRGRSSCCKKPLSWRYPLVELLTGCAFILPYTVAFPDASWFIRLVSMPQASLLSSLGMTWSWLLFSSSLIVIFFADLKYHIIPDEAVIGLIMSLVLPIIQLWTTLSSPLQSPLYGAVAIMLSILMFYLITLGRGMGFGDVKFAFPMGLALGMKSGFVALYVAFVSGGLISIVMLGLRRRGLKSAIAFGPFLVFGLLVMLFWEKEVWKIVARMF